MPKFKSDAPHRINPAKFKGLEDNLKIFNDCRLLSFMQDPGFGYDHVYMFLMEFRKDGVFGVFIYDTNSKEFIEEPGPLEGYDIASISKLYQKYPKHRWTTSLK